VLHEFGISEAFEFSVQTWLLISKCLTFFRDYMVKHAWKFKSTLFFQGFLNTPIPSLKSAKKRKKRVAEGFI